MELVNLTLVPILIKNNIIRRNRGESVLLYFIFQSYASILVLISIYWESWSYRVLGICVAICVKLGLAPFHTWVVPLLSYQNWNMVLVLLFPTKIPFYICILNYSQNSLILFMWRILTGCYLSFRATTPKIVIITSSIATGGILILCGYLDLFWKYFVMYGLSLILWVQGEKLNDDFIKIIGCLALIGIPLLPLFMPKIMLVRILVSSPVIFSLTIIVFVVSPLFYWKLLPFKVTRPPINLRQTILVLLASMLVMV